MVCQYCSEEHPVTAEVCPLTGQPLRPPVVLEALPDRPERTPFLALLGEAWTLYRRNLFAFVVTASIATAPVGALQVLSGLGGATPPGAQEVTRVMAQAQREHRALTRAEQAEVQRVMGAARPDFKQVWPAFALLLLLFPLVWAAQLLSQAALVPLVGDRALGGGMGPGRAWLAVGLHAGAILWTALLSTALTVLASVFCLLPGVVAALGFSLAMPVVLLEGRSGFDALRRSWRLMAIEWPRVLGMWATGFAGMAVLGGALLPLLLRVAGDPALLWGRPGVLVQAAQLALTLLVFPLPVIGTTLVYLHARREQENLPLAELQLQMQRAASGG